MKAIVAVMDGEVVGCIGVIRDRDAGRYFADFKEKLTPHLKSITIMRAVKASLRFVEEYAGPVVSVSEDAEGVMILTRLGFTHIEGELFAWLN